MRSYHTEGRRRDEEIVVEALSTRTWMLRSDLREEFELTGRSLERILAEFQANGLLVVALAPYEPGSAPVQVIGWRATCFTSPAIAWDFEQVETAQNKPMQLTEAQYERVVWHIDARPVRLHTMETISQVAEGHHPHRRLLAALFPVWKAAVRERRPDFQLTIAG